MTRLSFLCVALITPLAVWGCDGDSMGDLDGGGGTDGGGTIDGGGGADGGGMTDGGGPGDDGGTGVDASDRSDGGGDTTDAGPVGVECMGMTCSAPTPQCCIVRDPSGGGTTASCISADARCMGIVASCDGPEDCPGTQQCCVGFGSIGSGAASCQDACGIGARAACHEAMTCPTGDGRALMCCPFAGGGFTGSVCLPMCIGTGVP